MTRQLADAISTNTTLERLLEVAQKQQDSVKEYMEGLRTVLAEQDGRTREASAAADTVCAKLGEIQALIPAKKADVATEEGQGSAQGSEKNRPVAPETSEPESSEHIAPPNESEPPKDDTPENQPAPESKPEADT